MTLSFAYLLTLPALVMIATAAIPPGAANRHVATLRRWVTAIAGLQCLIGAFGLLSLVSPSTSTFHTDLITASAATPLSFSVYYDGVSALMFALVGLVGWIICRFSIRYLDGEPGQGRYFRWTSFTVGSVSLLVVSGNLLMLFLCWIATSFGLHQLLMHYGHRPAARRAAWTKFAISRIGDVALVGAIAALLAEFGTLEFAELFAAVGTPSMEVTPTLQVASLLLIVGAMTKSAQFPFHTWLPQTLETPTPVSALMHAGIVNAGGYLIVRTSPIVSTAPWTLAILAIVGGVTACFAAVVMLTQTSVKKSLAYSTIAQMGFMLFQCGLGAFSAAMLHIVAHSLYKAYAFLNSGNVMSQRKSTIGAIALTPSVHRAGLGIAGTVLLVAAGGTLLSLLGVSLPIPPIALILSSIFILAITHWIVQVTRAGDSSLIMQSSIVAGCLALAYAAGYWAVDLTIHASLPAVTATPLQWIAGFTVLAAFTALFALQVTLAQSPPSQRLRGWYVHVANGFYVDSVLRRVFAPLRSI